MLSIDDKWLPLLLHTLLSSSRLDTEPLSSSAKEFLFPCARDDFVLSKNLEDGGEEGEEINGEGWVEFAEESLCR